MKDKYNLFNHDSRRQQSSNDKSNESNNTQDTASITLSKQLDENEFNFSGEKYKDLLRIVLQGIHYWKQNYNVSIPDDIIINQLVQLYTKMKEIYND